MQAVLTLLTDANKRAVFIDDTIPLHNLKFQKRKVTHS